MAKRFVHESHVVDESGPSADQSFAGADQGKVRSWEDSPRCTMGAISFGWSQPLYSLLSCANGSSCLYEWKTTCERFFYAAEHRVHGGIKIRGLEGY